VSALIPQLLRSRPGRGHVRAGSQRQEGGEGPATAAGARACPAPHLIEAPWLATSGHGASITRAAWGAPRRRRAAEICLRFCVFCVRPAVQVRLVFDQERYPAWYIGPNNYNPQLFVDEFWMTDDQVCQPGTAAMGVGGDRGPWKLRARRAITVSRYDQWPRGLSDAAVAQRGGLACWIHLSLPLTPEALPACWQLIKLNRSDNSFSTDVSFDLMSAGRWRFQRHMEQSFKMNAELFGEDSEEMLQMRDLFANTHPCAWHSRSCGTHTASRAHHPQSLIGSPCLGVCTHCDPINTAVGSPLRAGAGRQAPQRAS
jgi:hypothetical protein